MEGRDFGRYPVPPYANEVLPHGMPRWIEAPPLPQPTDESVNSLPERPGCRHDESRDCEVHGCPACRAELEARPWIDACQTCAQLRQETFVAFVQLNPAVACELQGHLHCEDCGQCAVCVGQVCNSCRLCLACAAEDEWGPCAQLRWSKTLRAEVFSRFVHEFLHPVTDRWTRFDTRTARWLP